MNVFFRVLGFPGEMLSVAYAPSELKGKLLDPIGAQGQYSAKVLLARPERIPLRDELFHKIGDEQGDSYLKISYPKSDRQKSDIHSFNLRFGPFHLRVLPNDQGFAGTVEIAAYEASNHENARNIASDLLSNFLSVFASTCDAPVVVDVIETMERSTGFSSIRRRADSWPAWIDPVKRLAYLSPQFLYIASLYREALTSNSAAYRFVCFHRVIEALFIIRGNEAEEAHNEGTPVRRFEEKIPRGQSEQDLLLSRVWPWVGQVWGDPITRQQVFLPQTQGKSFKQVKDESLTPMRNKIAHGLMSDDSTAFSIDDWRYGAYVEAFLPLIHIIARTMMMNQYPKAYEF